MNKRISLVVMITLIIATAGYLVWARATEDDRGLADADCPSDAPIMTLNISGDLRQDNVAVLRGGGRIDVLTDDNASFDASFSPDGRQMVFTTGREGSHEETLGFSQLQIYVMDSDGTDQRRLMEEPQPDPEVSHAVDFGREGRTGPIPSSGASPDWSPDGSEIAFTDGAGLMVVSASGGEPKNIYTSDIGIEHIEWSPDGDRIVFFQSEKLHVIDVDSGEVDVLGKGIPRPTGLSWSPNGDALTYGTDEGIYTLSIEGSKRRLFARGAYTPAWSPDGKSIAYFIDDEERGDSTRELMVRPLGGGEPRRVKVDRDSLYSFETNLEWLNCTNEA